MPESSTASRLTGERLPSCVPQLFAFLKTNARGCLVTHTQSGAYTGPPRRPHDVDQRHNHLTVIFYRDKGQHFFRVTPRDPADLPALAQKLKELGSPRIRSPRPVLPTPPAAIPPSPPQPEPGDTANKPNGAAAKGGRLVLTFRNRPPLAGRNAQAYQRLLAEDATGEKERVLLTDGKGIVERTCGYALPWYHLRREKFIEWDGMLQSDVVLRFPFTASDGNEGSDGKPAPAQGEGSTENGEVPTRKTARPATHKRPRRKGNDPITANAQDLFRTIRKLEKRGDRIIIGSGEVHIGGKLLHHLGRHIRFFDRIGLSVTYDAKRRLTFDVKED